MSSTATLSPPPPPLARAAESAPAAPVTVAELRACRAELASLVDRFDASSLSGFDAAVAVEVGCEIERLSGALKVLAAPRVIETGSWADRGATSAPRWLAHASKSTVGDAARTLDTATQLDGLAATQGRVRQGRLSPIQAREVADAATADPSAEAGLLGIAERSSVAELKAKCRAVKAAASPESADEQYDKVRRARRLSHWVDEEGGFNLTGRSTVDDGALLKAILDPIADRLFREAHRAGRRESTQAYRWDALVEVFRRAGLIETNSDLCDLLDLDDHDEHDDLEDGDGDQSTANPPPGDAAGREPSPQAGGQPLEHRRKRPASKRRRRSPTGTVGSRAKVIVRIDHSALVRGWVESDEVCDLAGVGPIPVRIARQMLGEAFLAAIVMKGTDVHTVAHLGRRATVFQSTALDWTDATCSTEGCPNVVRLETDHTTEWHRTHHTTLTELGRPCGACHGLRSHQGYRYGPVNPATGKRKLHPPGAAPHDS